MTKSLFTSQIVGYNLLDILPWENTHWGHKYNNKKKEYQQRYYRLYKAIYGYPKLLSELKNCLFLTYIASSFLGN